MVKHKKMVEHDFILGQQEDTKGVKKREKHETQIKNDETRTGHHH